MKKDLIILGLVYTLLIQFGVSIHTNYKLSKTSKQLQEAKQVVWYVSDKLDLAYEMVDSLNNDNLNILKELSEHKRVERLTKELR